ncbi:MAG: arginine deiminase family protein [Bacteroidales bacterium]
MNNKYKVNVNSEIGELEAVIVHTPGSEVENMTPENAERALYSDILNLGVARQEFDQLIGVLEKVTRVFQVEDLLASVLKNERVKSDLIHKVTTRCLDPRVTARLANMDSETMARQLIQGVVLQRDSLSRYLSSQRFAIRPLHNFFYTRDASVAMFDKVMISRMASPVRERETQIMEAIFDFYPEFDTSTFSARAEDRACENVSIEGGDVLIGRDDLMLIGIGARTTPEGVDVVIDRMKDRPGKQHIIVQELPTNRESFIHLDMVFTFLSQSECMVYEPVVMQPNRFKTIHITVDGNQVKITETKNILDTLTQIGIDVKPVYCGGTADSWVQEREQWHSGANFFAVGPGKIIGYSRNVYTINELNKSGYEVIPASDVLSGIINLDDYQKYVVTIEGSELSRGGGGARCMTMPVCRKPVSW